MAQRRMFSKKITDTDTFLDMPLSSQALYFHLNMHADDDGFVSNVKTVKRMIGSSDDDLKLLLTKNFIFAFESGVVVIKDWKIHNYIRKDTYNTTIYGDEKEQLSQDENGSYTLSPRAVDEPSPQVRLGKVRLGKDSNIYSSSNDEPHIDLKTFKEIISYLNEKAGTKYRASGSKTQRLIKARFNDGFNDEDFKKVINIKVAEWSGTDMAKYLRPETLFGTKFESYLNQEVKKSKTNKGGDSYGGLEF
ncbi:DNA replication protein [Pediococcus stilesii]|uniref:DNA replication protein n=1 Tax=Pediococcus stilesii TaxID=331679 RepID=A0A5R9BSG8_9LACO|nr:conserved phage C-terminal domain-containing protein [Pediococcus stilesii]TLQ03624.1 DNA replication protein [Pediococcus stilesii]